MSDIFKCVEKLLNDNGVRVDVEELQLNHPDDDMRCVRIEKKILTLDFSAHDKVFENEIAGLKEKIAIKDMDYKTVSGLLSNYQQENESLKQHIAELESKEDEKPTKYITVIVAKEINGQEYVRLEDFMSVVNDLQAQIGT